MSKHLKPVMLAQLLSIQLSGVGAMPAEPRALTLSSESSDIRQWDKDTWIDCHSKPNHEHSLDTRTFCSKDGSCFPPFYLLGAQKAGTTSMASVL